jgi:hypothetical protein
VNKRFDRIQENKQHSSAPWRDNRLPRPPSDDLDVIELDQDPQIYVGGNEELDLKWQSPPAKINGKTPPS